MPHKNASVAIIQAINQALNAPQGHKRKNVINPDSAHKPFSEFYCKRFTLSHLMIRKGPISYSKKCGETGFIFSNLIQIKES